MQLCFYFFSFWKFYLSMYKIHCNISVCEVCHIRSMVVVLTFEFRISCMFFEKFLICGIHIVNSIGLCKLIHIFQPFIFFLSFPVTIIITIRFADGLLFFFVSIFPICQCSVIHKTAVAKCFCKLYFLLFIWIYSIFICF